LKEKSTVMGLFNKTFCFDPAAERLLNRLIDALNQFTKTGETLMGTIDDLTTAVNNAVAEVTKAIPELQALSAQVISLTSQLAAAVAAGNTAQVEALVGELNTATANLDAGLVAAAASLPAPPSPAPVAA